ncbi:Uncharacterised protein [Mycobacteroides abscessus subsp. abscessus]|nr:Uncharacterised protein [Mycobacteroides abscessus subsp. abscessus]
MLCSPVQPIMFPERDTASVVSSARAMAACDFIIHAHMK